MPTRREALLAALMSPAALRAADEERVRVLSSTDELVVRPLLDDFERRHPGLRVDYVQLGSLEVAGRFLADGGTSADVLWSSAMDQQIKLVNDGHAAAYESPHAEALPRWAVWKHEAYGATFEPVGWVHNRRLFSEAEAPNNRRALVNMLRGQQARFRGRVATYDVQRSGLGFLIAANDAMASPQSWGLVRALGACDARVLEHTRAMLESVASGESLIACNVIGTYAEAFARQRRDLAIVYPQDYTLVTSRVAFIARLAPNPRGARLWLDHLLSPEGQRVLREQCGLFSVRGDLTQPRSGASLAAQLGNAARPIALGPGLLAFLDQSKHDSFLKRWRHEFQTRS